MNFASPFVKLLPGALGAVIAVVMLAVLQGDPASVLVYGVGIFSGSAIARGSVWFDRRYS